VTVNPAGAQRIDGFGASGAWWPNDLVAFPADVQKRVGDMLFGPNGLALSGYRYNIGGGGEGVTNPARAPRQFPADTAGRTFLRMAVDAHVPVITGFVNSAPPQFTTNGKACGGSLKPGAEAAFARYLANVASKASNAGTPFNYVSPMNEPDDSFPDCGQEGMSVPVAQRGAVVQALAKALRAKLLAKVIADETTADAILAAEVPKWLDATTASDMAAIAHHTYDFPNDALRQGVARLDVGLPTWMTEICCYKGSGGVGSGFGANYDPTMTQAFWLADQIYDDLTVARDSAWYWWTALSPVLGCDPKADPECPARANTKGFNDGLLYYDEHHATSGITQLFTTRRFYALGQFSRYVRPGAIRHDVTGVPQGVRMMAFATGNAWSVVAWNEGSSTARVGITLPQSSHVVASTAAAQTNEKASLSPTAPPARTASGAWFAEIPPQTIVTYTLN
jgi:O-glycosyl hydrolase